ncbi:MAG: quinone-dependent dihydroorotate dehydrogenase [Methanobacteriota archaeon]|nr:MAG: quinone-dependent dihydroorotate dehydrogenase [Euryarchaeota archaeon]
MIEWIIKQIFFLFEPETAHHLFTLFFRFPLMGKLVGNASRVTHPSLNRELFGLRFPNPVGLAAGFDKNALMVDALLKLGFGFVEIGTVTPRPQAGNPRPRLFRLPEDKALINRMGFNNDGVEVIVQRLRKRRVTGIVGGNIGKNKITPNDLAWQDYEKCFQALFPYVDYFVVNVSSPNTPDLRKLQDKEPLQQLLSHLQHLNQQHLQPKPILLKISPDLTRPQLDDILEIVETCAVAGIVATNTTISREGVKSNHLVIRQIGAGGLSGAPLKERATEVIRYLHQSSGGKIPIIGVGGVFSAEDALEKLDAGASLIQLYTGFVYRGPRLIREINQALRSN